MAFETKNKAKKFGSRFAAAKYDQHHPAEEGLLKSAKEAPEPKEAPEHEAAETPQFEAGEQEGAQEQPAQTEMPAQVVAKHGKASHVHVSHDHENNKHHVHSVHADGHVHDSDHASQQEAQDAAKQLGGGDQQASPSMMAEDEGAPESDGFKMPRLA